VTGRLWTGDADDLGRVVADFDDEEIRPSDCVANAARFDSSVFRAELPAAVRRAVGLVRSRRVEREPGRDPIRERPAVGIPA
jgi:hypothetical protein